MGISPILDVDSALRERFSSSPEDNVCRSALAGVSTESMLLFLHRPVVGPSNRILTLYSPKREDA